MKKKDREQLVKFMRTWLGHAERGHVMPFKATCVELDIKRGEHVASRAQAALEDARMFAADSKPTTEQLVMSLQVALLRVEEGEFPR